MADAEDIQPLVCDNGTGMVKVSLDLFINFSSSMQNLLIFNGYVGLNFKVMLIFCRLVLLVMTLQELSSLVLLVVLDILVLWLEWDKKMPM